MGFGVVCVSFAIFIALLALLSVLSPLFLSLTLEHLLRQHFISSLGMFLLLHRFGRSRSTLPRGRGRINDGLSSKGSLGRSCRSILDCHCVLYDLTGSPLLSQVNQMLPVGVQFPVEF